MNAKMKLVLYRVLSLFRRDPLVVALRQRCYTVAWRGRISSLPALSGGGELALTKLQAGIETVRGTSVAATRILNGRLEPHRDQPLRGAIEDRGIFPEKMRATRKLVDAGWRFVGDLTPEDFPYYLDMMLKGGMAGVQIGTAGAYTWSCVPDQSTDSLKTRTFEWGDDSIQYRGAFGVMDQLDVAIPLDDAVSMTAQGWVEEWVPAGAEGFTGFTGALSQRNVESTMGWQQRLFFDLASGTIGTTQIANRFVSAALAWRNQNRRKYFGDGSPRFTLLGRGRRQISMGLVAEALDQVLVSDLFASNQKQNTVLPIERAARIMLIGSAVGTTLGASSAITAAGTVSAIAVTALAQAIPGGTAIQMGGVTFVVAPAGAAAAATSIPVIPQTIAVAIPSVTAIFACKSISFDYWGYFDGNPNWGNRDTNRTFQLMLQAVYDTGQAKEHQITVVNGLPTASGIS